MPPKRKQCSCKQHDNYSQGKEFVVYKNDGKKIRKSATEALIENGDLFAHSTYICNACASFAEDKLCKKKKITIKEYLNEFLEAIDSGVFCEESLGKIAGSIGRFVARQVAEDATSCSNEYKDASFIQQLNFDDWMHKRNSVLIRFLHGLSGDTNIGVNKVRAMEQLYYLCNRSFVAPFSFSNLLMLYFATGSKTAVSLLSSGLPCGSYSTLQRWIQDHGTIKLECPKDFDIVTFFDNNQILQRKWRVQYDFKSTASVFTNIIHILPEKNSTLQKQEQLSPCNWLHASEECRDVPRMLMEHQAKMNEKFRIYRDEFIAQKIESVWEEHALGTDYVDGNNVQLKNRADERYSFVVSQHPEEPPSVVMGEPCFENPCSYDAIDEVLSHISDLTMCGDRKWTILGCDALPYTLGSRLIDSSFLCPTCHREFIDAPSFDEHRNDSEHSTTIRMEQCKKFKNVLLIPGLGHYEINMVKSIISFMWKVAFEDLGKMLGFKSPTALASLRACADHHKSWQVLQIFLHAVSEELLTPYVRHCKTTHIHPSLRGYYEWLKTSQPTVLYEFMREVVFTYCLSIHVFRAGVRRNNTDAINCSKAKFAPLFFGLNMPFYMETYIRDSLTRIQCPPEVLAFIERHESYSVSGNDSKGEGGDFVLEAKNRETKRLVPSGVPTNQIWTNICRNVDRLGKIRSKVYELQTISSTDTQYSYAVDLSREIFEFRKMVRSSGWFASRTLISIGGVTLDEELLHFSRRCQDNMLEFLESSGNDLSCRRKFQPIFVLPEEREKHQALDNQTRATLLQMVEDVLDNMSLSLVLSYKQRWKSVKSKSKSAIIHFLEELREVDK